VTAAADDDERLPPEVLAPFRVRLERDARRLAAIRDGLAAAGAPPLVDDPRWAELDRLAHGLVGAGGTFGFPEVSAAAEDVERLTGLRTELVAEADAECRRLALLAALRLHRTLLAAERDLASQTPSADG
jgi:hypothetical protein